jgi:hypothetical protein
MKARLKLSLKIAWLTAAIVILLMGTNLCASTDQSCFDAGETMFFLMFWLSFPTGVLFLLVSLFFIGVESVHYPSDYITMWLIMACGGCLQWYVLIPRIFARPEFTVLKLEQKDVIPKMATAKLRSATRHPKIKPIRAFDKRGRTPLERAMSHRL